MMRKLVWLLSLALAVAPVLSAQDSATADSAERERLQQAIERRFGQVVRQQLGLTEDQARRLRQTEERFRVRRRAIVRRQLQLQLALQDQMLPGNAADPDSVRRLMDGLQASRIDMLQLDQEQDREMAGYLTPVQRARYQMLRERLLNRLREIRRQRTQGRGSMRRPQR
jgi:periplasmic protein CpxP/Spy